MRLIDADKLKKYTVKIVNNDTVHEEVVVYARDLAKAESCYAPKPEKTIPVRWLQRRMSDAIANPLYSDEHLDTKYFCMINKFIAEYEEEMNK